MQDTNLQVVAEGIVGNFLDAFGRELVLVNEVVDSHETVVGKHYMEILFLHLPTWGTS